MKYFFAVIPVLFLIRCSNPKHNENAVSEKIIVKDSCCAKTETDSIGAILSEITCPKCAYKKNETMPTDICLIKYTCENCQAVLFPKEGDCCVFCTYGTHKCPSKQ